MFLALGVIDEMAEKTSGDEDVSKSTCDQAKPDIVTNFPLHWLVWHNDFRDLEKALASGKVSIYFFLN